MVVAIPASATGAVLTDSWTDSVVRTEATLKAKINPEGAATTYRIEYGPTSAYGSSTPERNVGSDSTVHTVTSTLTGLQPDSTYHWRVVTTSASVSEGPDHAFTTYPLVQLNTNCPNQGFRAGRAASLPNCRAYEMVSPVDKNGGGIVTACSSTCTRTAHNQASISGDKMTFSSYKAFADAVGAAYSNQYIATRGNGGWTTHAISPALPGGPPEFRTLDIEFRAFMPDLSFGWIQSEEGWLRRDNSDDTYQTLIDQSLAHSRHFELEGYSDDATHAVYSGDEPLTPDALTIPSLRQIYDISGGEIHLASVLPDGTPSALPSSVGGHAGGLHPRQGTLTHAVSDDGSRIFWGTRVPQSTALGPLYVRKNPGREQSAVNGAEECTEPAKACTVLISGGVSQFWTASADGSEVIYSRAVSPNQDFLYRFDLDSEVETPIVDKAYGVLGASDDLSYLYFVSDEALDPSATSGKPNLYVDHEGTVGFIATLSLVDVGQGQSINEVSGYDVVAAAPIERASRVTPDGRHIAFQSIEGLTGYDNTDAKTGERDIEIFTYDAEAQKLTCASCNPSGARPHGDYLRRPFLAVDEPASNNGIGQRGTAAWLTTAENQLYSPRALSDDGSQLFFNSYDPLMPEDTNGVQDVYQWEAQGSGSCSETDGCISLISSGESTKKSEFVDASPDGEDVFFETGGSLLPQDRGEIDLYDARVDGGVPTPPAPPECIGDACQSIPSPPLDPTPASAGFRGAGDPQVSNARARCRTRKANRSKQGGHRVRHQKAKRCKRAKRRTAK